MWLDGSGDWAWPGTGGGEAAVELLPPPWVPASPRRAEPAIPQARRPQRGLARRYGASLLLTMLAAACVGLALDGRTDVERLVGSAIRFASLRGRDYAGALDRESSAVVADDRGGEQ